MSTIFADKFKNTSGGNPVQINQLRGIDTAGSITVQGEGTATTNLQQGLAKHFNIFKGTDTFAAIDSFNQSSLTDVSTGLHRTSFTSSFGSINYAVTGSIVGSTVGGYYSYIASDGGNKLASSVDTLTINSPGNSAVYDMDVVQLVSHGDLA